MAFPQTVAPTVTAFATDTTSHAVTMPPVVNVGDLLLALLASNTQSGNATPITTPAGWTEKSTFYPGTSVRLGVYAKVADGSEDGTTVDFVSAPATQAVAQVYRVTSWYGTIAGVEVGVSVNGTSTTPDPPSLSPSWGALDTLWIALAFPNNSDSTLSVYPTDYSNGVYTATATGTSGAALASARRELNAASDDPGTFTVSISAVWAAQTVAIRPATPGVAAVTATRLESSLVSANTVATTASYTKTAGRPLWLWLINDSAATPTITDSNGLVWNLVLAQNEFFESLGASYKRYSLYYAIPGSTVAGTTTMTYGATQQQIFYHVGELAGDVNASNPFLQATGADADYQSPSPFVMPSLATLQSSTAFVLALFFTDGAATSSTLGSGWTLIYNESDRTVSGIKQNDAQPSISWTGVSDRQLGIAAEIRSPDSAGVGGQGPRSMTIFRRRAA